MVTVYVYILDTLADWELGYVTSELHSGRFFKKGAPQLSLKTVGNAKDPIHTMGGLTVVPDCLIDDVAVCETSVLLLPGANTWNDPKQGAIIEKASEDKASTSRLCRVRKDLFSPTFSQWSLPRLD